MLLRYHTTVFTSSTKRRYFIKNFYYHILVANAFFQAHQPRKNFARNQQSHNAAGCRSDVKPNYPPLCAILDLPLNLCWHQNLMPSLHVAYQIRTKRICE